MGAQRHAVELYSRLIAASAGTSHDAFDVHVVASILAIAIEEAEQEGIPPLERIGLQADAFRALAGAMFPADTALGALAGDTVLTMDAEEQSVFDLLWMFATTGDGLQRDLAAMIARRGLQPHHLWQDLGLRNRGELSRLMQAHFAPLARRNNQDMKWKKFLYRMVCGSEGFTICASPVCSDCDDYDHCFGAETGQALLIGDEPPVSAESRDQGAA